MVTDSEINEVFYQRFVEATQGENPAISIGGVVCNKDREETIGEDIVVITTGVVGDEFPQNALVNINAYTFDVPESGNGFVRNGQRLSELVKAIADYLETLVFDNMEFVVENIAEVEEKSINQHYKNFRVRLFIYDNFS